MTPLEVLAQMGYRTHCLGTRIDLIPVEAPMTIDELETAVWNARATLRLDGTARPIIRHGSEPLAPEVIEAIQEHREEIVNRLRGLGGARLEGLVCSLCVPEAVTGQPTGYRGCPEHGGQLHYPRVS